MTKRGEEVELPIDPERLRDIADGIENKNHEAERLGRTISAALDAHPDVCGCGAVPAELLIGPTGTQFSCSTCRVVSEAGDTRQEAIRLWNTRPERKDT